VPEEWRPGFDAVLAAFDHAAAGRDDAAREALQVIGLGSPFLDWKLLVRGLLAYYAGDDGRALDNWSRLIPDRLPARLAAPLRFALDPAFRAAQSPKAFADLRRRADRLHGGLLPGLRELQSLLAGPYRVADAFRRGEALLPALRREQPDLVPKLAEAFRAAIVAGGSPPDLDRHRRLFGKPPDDPNFERLEALALEERRQWHDAHALWQKYEKTLQKLPGWLPADVSRARALVWCRMGHNAAGVLDEESPFPGFAIKPRGFKPTPEQYFRRALELAPDLLDAHVELLQFYLEKKNSDKAGAAGRALLERFPGHGPTLEALADLARKRGDSETAWDYLRRAAEANPLDRRLRGRFADAHRARARSRAAAGELTGARDDLTAAVALGVGRPDLGAAAQSAAVAFKLGDAGAAEEFVRWAEGAGPKPAAALALLAEATRLKLPAKLKRRFDADVTAALNGPPDPRTAAAFARVVADQQRAGATYLGQKTHEKKVQAYVERAIKATAAERDFDQLCTTLAELGWWKPLKAAAQQGQRRFRASPFFPYYAALAAHRLNGRDVWKVEPMLDQADRLAAALPRDERVARLLDDVAGLRRQVDDAGPMFGVLNQFFEAFDDDDRPF
jgi:tetratricopeptide (TPR) repeat protein